MNSIQTPSQTLTRQTLTSQTLTSQTLTSQTRSNQIRYWLALALTVVCLAALSWPLPAAAQPGRPVLVKVAAASMQSLSPVAVVPGTVVSRSDARLSAEVEGRLVSVAEVGARVTQGEVIAVIDDRSLLLRGQELAAEIMRAEANLEFLERELERFSRLAESQLASANQYEQTRAERDVARGDLEVARSRQSQNDYLLSRTRVVAPFGGIVVERLMTPGEWVTEGSQVARLVDQEHLEVIARAPLEYYAFTQPGLRLELRAGAVLSSGTVRTVVAVGDENTHLFELRLDLEENGFPAGQTLRVAVPTAAPRDVLTIPRDALVLRPEGQSIFVINADGQATRVAVSTGLGADDRIEVTGDVSAGDRVVIRGNERLQAGDTVSIMEP